ncbi:hypothetical protein B0T17DRAFT_593066 [Bombardia bombarda]|uniref:Zn(2)-C6 fungal-type domain-containing protein n=1 Tax=Bombardia bombarda TaxID=252184 RepID=A0AA39WHA3_9PEZI|nr:hypothetical protein B0T17DRAFT_593066 [Bombardia bombarda]
MAGGSRNLHTKSRNGCGQCKKRRVKCNLQAPICNHCKRRREICDYQFPDMGVVVNTTKTENALSVPTNTENPMRSPSPLSRIVILWIQGEDFWHMEQEIAKQINQHAFLQENLSAVSTLYMSHSDTMESLDVNVDRYLIACQHQVAASGLFRVGIGAVTEDNWLAVLVFAIAVIIFHFDITRRPARPSDSQYNFLEPIFTLRSAANLLLDLGPLLQRSWLGDIIRRYVRDELKPPWDFLAEQTIAGLHGVNDAFPHDHSHHDGDICRDTIRKLQFWLRLVSCQPRTWLHFMWWPGAVKQEYLILLSQRHPIALVIFVHWCAVMANARRVWFLDGWAATTARPVLEYLAPEWHDAVSWAKTKLAIPQVD